jgi:hypothetical protein
MQGIGTYTFCTSTRKPWKLLPECRRCTAEPVEKQSEPFGHRNSVNLSFYLKSGFVKATPSATLRVVSNLPPPNHPSDPIAEILCSSKVATCRLIQYRKFIKTEIVQGFSKSSAAIRSPRLLLIVKATIRIFHLKESEFVFDFAVRPALLIPSSVRHFDLFHRPFGILIYSTVRSVFHQSPRVAIA